MPVICVNKCSILINVCLLFSFTKLCVQTNAEGKIPVRRLVTFITKINTGFVVMSAEEQSDHT